MVVERRNKKRNKKKSSYYRCLHKFVQMECSKILMNSGVVSNKKKKKKWERKERKVFEREMIDMWILR